MPSYVDILRQYQDRNRVTRQYQPTNPFCMELNQKSITAIDIEITFQNEEQRVHFGRGDWEVNLLIEYRLNMEKTAPPHTIHRNILKSLEIDWKSIEINGNPWRSIEIHGNQWKSMEIHCNP